MNADDMKQMSTSWKIFVDELEPLRPKLFRFSLALTGNPFDAEDLVADSMLRIFSALAFTNRDIKNLEAYVFRTTSRLWIDQQRRSKTEPLAEREPHADADPEDLTEEVTDAASQLYAKLNPLQRAIVVLKEVLEMSHTEIAKTLSISEGSARVTLHRANQRLSSPRVRTPRATRETVERFVEALQSYDVVQIRQMLVDDFESNVFPSGVGVGADEEVKDGWVVGALYLHQPKSADATDPIRSELQVSNILGDIVILVFRGHQSDAGRALEEVWLVEEDDGRVSRVRDYGFSPDLTQWIAEHINETPRSVGYRLKENTFAHLR
jgi:RNA polymerase sigma-70 factor (ECF subfamily)